MATETQRQAGDRGLAVHHPRRRDQAQASLPPHSRVTAHYASSPRSQLPRPNGGSKPTSLLAGAPAPTSWRRIPSAPHPSVPQRGGQAQARSVLLCLEKRGLRECTLHPDYGRGGTDAASLRADSPRPRMLTAPQRRRRYTRSQPCGRDAMRGEHRLGILHPPAAGAPPRTSRPRPHPRECPRGPTRCTDRPHTVVAHRMWPRMSRCSPRSRYTWASSAGSRLLAGGRGPTLLLPSPARARRCSAVADGSGSACRRTRARLGARRRQQQRTLPRQVHAVAIAAANRQTTCRIQSRGRI